MPQDPPGNWSGSKSNMLRRAPREATAGITAQNEFTTAGKRDSISMTAARKILDDMGIDGKDEQNLVMDQVVDKEAKGNSHTYDRTQLVVAANAFLQGQGNATEAEDPKKK